MQETITWNWESYPVEREFLCSHPIKGILCEAYVFTDKTDKKRIIFKGENQRGYLIDSLRDVVDQVDRRIY